MDEFEVMLLVCWALVTLMFTVVLILHGLGVAIMRLRDRRSGKKRFYILRREM